MPTTPESVALSKELRKRGWSFVGPTTVYAFMQAMGLVNDHLEGCVCRETAGAGPTVSNDCAYDTAANTLKWGVNGVTETVAFLSSNVATVRFSISGISRWEPSSAT